MDVFKASGIDVFYSRDQNGGGMHFGQDFVEVVSQRYGKVKKIYEFCSGPAYIGFSLLGAGLCDYLVLSDIYKPLRENINKTIRENDLNAVVDYHELDGVKSLPDNDINLVVSNPPHFSEPVGWLKHIDERIYLDTDWKIHKEFYANIGSHLAKNGVILLQENTLGSSISDFEMMISDAGLHVRDIFEKHKNSGNDQIYYIELIKK